MASKRYTVILVALLFCLPALNYAQEKKLPGHIQQIFINYDTCLYHNRYSNIDIFRTLFHPNVVDTIKLINDLYYTGYELGYFSEKAKMTISDMSNHFAGTYENGYLTNISNEFLQFEDRVTLQNRRGYKLYQFRLNKAVYFDNSGIFEYKNIPYYFSLLSYTDPNNATIKKAKIISINDQKVKYPKWYIPESFSLNYQFGNNLSNSGNVSDIWSQNFGIKANFLLTGLNFFTLYLHLGAGLANNSFDLTIKDFNQSFPSVDIDGMDFTKNAESEMLNQSVKNSLIKIPVGLKGQIYQYKNFLNFYGSVGYSFYYPLTSELSNTSGKISYSGDYQFADGFRIRLSDLPQYGFSEYDAKPSDVTFIIKPLNALSAELGVNLRINRKFSFEAGLGYNYMFNEIRSKDNYEVLTDGDGEIKSLISYVNPDISSPYLSFAAVYNINNIRSPYTPVLNRDLFKLREQRISGSGLKTVRAELIPGQNIIMKSIKEVQYNYYQNNLAYSMVGKINRKKGKYYFKSKIPKSGFSYEIQKPVGYDLYFNESDKLSNDMILKVNPDDKNPIHIEKIQDIDVIILFKSNQSPPDNKFELYEPTIRRVAEIMQSAKNPVVMFAEDKIFVYNENPVIEDVKSYIRLILDNYGLVDLSYLGDFSRLLSDNSIMTKRRNVNLHFLFVYKDVLFDSFDATNDYISLFTEKLNLISGFEKNIFGNEYNNIQVNLWSNFTTSEVTVLNKYRSINESNWMYKIY